MTPSAGSVRRSSIHVIDAVHPPPRFRRSKQPWSSPTSNVCCICKRSCGLGSSIWGALAVPGSPHTAMRMLAPAPDFHERYYDAHSWAEWTIRTLVDPPNTHPTWMLIWIRCSTPIRMQSAAHKAAAQRACSIAYQRLIGDVDDDRARDMLNRFVAGQTHASLAGCINAALSMRPLAATR